MGIQWRGPIPQSNYTVGRDGNAVELIGHDGRIAQLVSEDETALPRRELRGESALDRHRARAWTRVPTECPGTLQLDRIVRDALRGDDMFTQETAGC